MTQRFYFLGIYTKELKTGIQKKYRYRQVQSSTIHNSQKVETQIVYKLINA